MQLIDKEAIAKLPVRKRKSYAVLIAFVALTPIWGAWTIGKLIWDSPAPENRLFLPLAILLIPGLIAMYFSWVMWPPVRLGADSPAHPDSAPEENRNVSKAPVFWGILLGLAIVGWSLVAQVFPDSLLGSAFTAISADFWRVFTLIVVVVFIVHKIANQSRVGRKPDA